MTTIGDLLQEYREFPSPGTSPAVLTLTERNGFVRQADRFHKRLATEDTSNYKVVRADDIAFNPYLLWAGAIAQNTIVDEGVISPLYPTFRVRDGHDSRYVARLLLTPQLLAAYDTIAFGSVPRRRRSSAKDFLGLEIPTPPILDEQRRIATVLDKASALRRKRVRLQETLDDLTRSIFLNLFGNSVANPNGWPRVFLGDVVGKIDSGSSPVCEPRQAAAGEWGVLKLGAVSYGIFRANENKAFLGDVSTMHDSEVRPGDLLMSRKNTKELVGATAVVYESPPRLLLPDLIYRLELDRSRVDPEYLHALLTSSHKRPQLVALASGSASSMANISRARLRRLVIELPPLDLQREFADRIGSVASARLLNDQAGAACDELFDSLQACAFSGEL